MPPSLLVGIPYTLIIQIDGQPPLQDAWTVTSADSDPSYHGAGPVVFTAGTTALHYINVTAISTNGVQEEQVFQVQPVLKRASLTSIAVAWGQIVYQANDTLSAEIQVNDAEGLPVSGLSWTLFRNGSPAPEQGQDL